MFQNVTLREVIAVAYGIGPLAVQHLVIGGSETIPMLRTLLADRFKLKASVDCNAPGARKPAGEADRTGACSVNPYAINKTGPGDMAISDRTPLTSLIMRIQPFMDRPVIDAALQEQLGIKAERRTAPFDIVVIDSVEMPTPN